MSRDRQDALVRSMLRVLRADIDRVHAAATAGDLPAVRAAVESARIELALSTSLLTPPRCLVS